MIGRDDPVCLLIPGIDGSGPDHWQTIWSRERADCELVDLGAWQLPDRNLWVSRLDAAIARRTGRPILLVAHSLGCLLVSWWSAGHPDRAGRIAGALLVAPCDVDRRHDPRLDRYAPMPADPLPFPTLLVGSTNDPYASVERLAGLADVLDADFVELGALGHINAGSGLGAWVQGQRLLELLRTPYGSAHGRARMKLTTRDHV